MVFVMIQDITIKDLCILGKLSNNEYEIKKVKKDKKIKINKL